MEAEAKPQNGWFERHLLSELARLKVEQDSLKQDLISIKIKLGIGAAILGPVVVIIVHFFLKLSA